MIKSLMTAVLGTRHERERKRLQPVVDRIHAEEEKLKGLSEAELKDQTRKFRERLGERTGAIKAELEQVKAAKHACADPVERDRLEGRYQELEVQYKRELKAALDDLLPEAYATVREACRRLVGTTVSVTGHELPWDMVPYDVQLIGGVVLHQGRIAEMATGEGKTLVATLPLYLNALAGRGAHLVTVNNYLARRDSQWMGHVYTYLGLNVACLDDTEPSSPGRRAAYQADITYGTNNEFGFDYLRDNMVFSLEQRVQREHAYAIIDEVDSILIDEARTPLIISGPVGNETDDKYAQFNRQVAELVRKQTGVVNGLLAEAERLLEDEKTRQDAALKLYQAHLGMPKNKRLLKMLQEHGIKQLVQRMELDAIADRKLPMRQQRMRDTEDVLYFVLDEKGHSVHLTDRGAEAMSPGDPTLFLVPDISEEIHRIDKDPELSPHDRIERRRTVESEYALKSEKLHIIHKLLQAHVLYEKEVDYLVQEGQVMIVDEFTGRVMTGRRWSDGLHQAVEAKEGVQVKGETQTFATITIQNYFRMYDKLAGMTGTAETEETEFYQIYGLEVNVIPTHRPVCRIDQVDRIYKTRREKYNAVLDEVERLHNLGWPILIGTVTVEVSETLSRQLKRRGLKHEVLNAKYHQREAEIVAAGGTAQLDHDRDQHGRPRHRHQAGQGSRPGPRGGGTPDHRHRAARVAPDRPSAARPVRAPGRSRAVDLLPLAGRRPDAALRVRPHRPLDGQERGGGGRGHHRRPGHPGHRAGAEAGRAAELPAAEAAAGVRRRDEPAAGGDLLAAALRAGAGRGAEGRGAADDRGRAGAGHDPVPGGGRAARRSTTGAGSARRSCSSTWSGRTRSPTPKRRRRWTRSWRR